MEATNNTNYLWDNAVREACGWYRNGDDWPSSRKESNRGKYRGRLGRSSRDPERIPHLERQLYGPYYVGWLSELSIKKKQADEIRAAVAEGGWQEMIKQAKRMGWDVGQFDDVLERAEKIMEENHPFLKWQKSQEKGYKGLLSVKESGIEYKSEAK